jgi:hypothetical protein
MKRSSILARALLAGGLVACGALLVWLWNARPALAVGTSQNEKVIICTGFLDESDEVVYVLDALTGDLRAFTMHPGGGGFSVSYYRNVLDDFGLDKSKSGQFTMVTGQERFMKRGGAANPINSVLYVAEATSGVMAAYTLPWNSAYRQKLGDVTKPYEIAKLGTVPYRGNVVRKPVSQ